MGTKGVPSSGHKVWLARVQMKAINTGGAPGVWRVLEAIETGQAVAEVWCFQETRADEEEMRTIEAKFSQLGFYIYHQSGRATVGRWKEEKALGGVMIAVHKKLKQKLISKEAVGAAQRVVVEVQGWMVANFYCPPSDKDDLYTIMQRFMVMEQVNAKTPIAVVGDWNEEPEEVAGRLLQKRDIVAVDDENHQPSETRWKGKKKLDWFATNRPSEVERMQRSSIQVSDHMIVETSLRTEEKRYQKIGRLERGADWRCPGLYRKKEWKQLLGQVWEEVEFTDPFLGLTMLSNDTEVEEDWRYFMQALHEFYSEVFRRAGTKVQKELNKANGTEEEREELDRVLTRIHRQLEVKVVKGRELKYIESPEIQKARIGSDEAMARCKHRKRLGRTRALTAKIDKHGWPLPREDVESQRLLRKVGYGLDDATSASEAKARLEDRRKRKTRGLEREEAAAKRWRLKKWQEQMRGGIKEVARWMSAKGRQATRLVSGATTREGVCGLIRQFWRDEWQEDVEATVSRQKNVEEAMLRPLAQHLKDVRMPAWEEDDLEDGMVCAMKKARGAAGTDGWHGDELAVLPEGLARSFYRITRKWRQRREAPPMMHYIIQAALQKPKKSAEVANLRPLSIFNTFWRVFEASTLNTKAFKEWRKKVGLPNVAHKESAEEVAALVATLYALLRFLGALDYSKAYDHMRPDISEQILLQAGVPEDLAELFGAVWSKQIRYITFDGHCSKETLEGGTAHPQGGPWGPAIMQLWMICGVLWTRAEEKRQREADAGQQRCGAPAAPPQATPPSAGAGCQEGTRRNVNRKREGSAELQAESTKRLRRTRYQNEADADGEGTNNGPANGRVQSLGRPGEKRRLQNTAERELKKRKTDTRVYMDDRTVVSAKARGMLQNVGHWQKWSKLVELHENAGKTQFLAKGPKALQELQEELKLMKKNDWNKYVTDIAEVLGVSIGATKLSPKETDRIKKFRGRCEILDRLRVPRSLTLMYKRALAMSVLAYGWVCHFPTERELNSLADSMFGKTLRGRSRHLRNVLEGGTLHPWAVLTCRLLNLVFTALSKNGGPEVLEWTSPAGTPVRLLRTQLKKMGWAEKGPFWWRHPDVDEDIQLQQPSDGATVPAKRTKKRLAHNVREGFRASQWHGFWRQSKRHELVALRAQMGDRPRYDGKRTALARKAADDTVRLAIMTGAVRSPAMMQHDAKFPTTCIACGELGTHDHVYWQCPAVAEKIGPRPTATDPLQRRYGWPSGAKALDSEVLDWMCKVTLEIWEVRYGNANKERQTKAGIKRRREAMEAQQKTDDEKEHDDERIRWLVKKAAFEDADSEEEHEEADEA